MKKSPVEIFRSHNGQLHMSEALKRGINRYTLYSMRDKGVIASVTRGVYRLVDYPPITNPDLVTVSIRFPNAVICLISALSFHGITSQIPHEISIAVTRGSRIHSLDYPPVRVHKFSDNSYEAGIEEHRIDDVPVKIFSIEKTLADCFKYRNKIGMDVALEALRLYRRHKKVRLDDLIIYARICRVQNVMKPYLEAIA